MGSPRAKARSARASSTGPSCAFRFATARHLCASGSSGRSASPAEASSPSAPDPASSGRHAGWSVRCHRITAPSASPLTSHRPGACASGIHRTTVTGASWPGSVRSTRAPAGSYTATALCAPYATRPPPGASSWFQSAPCTLRLHPTLTYSSSAAVSGRRRCALGRRVLRGARPGMERHEGLDPVGELMATRRPAPRSPRPRRSRSGATVPPTSRRDPGRVRARARGVQQRSRSCEEMCS